MSLSLLDRVLAVAGLARQSRLEDLESHLRLATQANVSLRRNISAERRTSDVLFMLSKDMPKTLELQDTLPTDPPVKRYGTVLTMKEVVMINMPTGVTFDGETAAAIRSRLCEAMMIHLSRKIVDVCSRLFTGANNHPEEDEDSGTEQDAGRDNLEGDHGDRSPTQHPLAAIPAASGKPAAKPGVVRGRKAARSRKEPGSGGRKAVKKSRLSRIK